MVHPVKLVVKDLSVARGGRTIISNLSLTLNSGEALLLTGANGAGKTTLIRAIAGLLDPAAGQIDLDNGSSDDRNLAQQSHYAGHLNGLKPSLSVAENLQFWADYLPEQREVNGTGRLDAALARLNLEALRDIPAAYLSAGQKRRAGLARILMADRPLWLLDEPTTSLDAASVALVCALVEAHRTSGGMAIIATHAPLAIAAPRTLHLSGATAAQAA